MPVSEFLQRKESFAKQVLIARSLFCKGALGLIYMGVVRRLSLFLFYVCLTCAVIFNSALYVFSVSSSQSLDRPKAICTNANGFESEVSVSAQGAVLLDADSGEVLLSLNENARLPMASTTKIMTALVALENYDISKTVSIPKGAVGIEGSSVYLFEGERMTMENLLYCLLLESANDAATAIAIEVAGSVEAFAQMMNDKAEQLRLNNTHFTNPHGLDDKEHYTSAHDLAIITREALQNPVFKTIVSTYKKTVPLNDTQGVRLLINHNRMLRMYDGTIGVKTGFTKRSGRCLVSAAERDGLTLIAVTINAPDDWRDHTAMLNYGFECYESVTLAQKGELTVQLDVVGGKQSYVTVSNIEDVCITLPRDCGTITYTVEMYRFAYAPVADSEKLGETVWKCGSKEIARTDLYASHAVEGIQYKKNIFERILEFFGF